METLFIKSHPFYFWMRSQSLEKKTKKKKTWFSLSSIECFHYFVYFYPFFFFFFFSSLNAPISATILSHILFPVNTVFFWLLHPICQYSSSNFYVVLWYTNYFTLCMPNSQMWSASILLHSFTNTKNTSTRNCTIYIVLIYTILEYGCVTNVNLLQTSKILNIIFIKENTMNPNV